MTSYDKNNSHYRLSIVPFDGNPSTNQSDWILHGEITQRKLLESIGDDVRNLCQMKSFIPTWAYIITYYENAPRLLPYNQLNYHQLMAIQDEDEYDKMASLKNTYQVLFVTNGNDSFAIYRYIKMEWPNNLFKPNNFEAGFYFDDFTNRKIGKYLIENSSLSNLVENSNMGIPGRWFINFNNDNCRFKYSYYHKLFTPPPKS